MFEFISRLFGKEEPKSKDLAKERLRLVLVHDRASVSPQFLEQIKEELIQVISKYMEIDREGMDIQLSNEDDSVALLASIPIRRIRRSGTGGRRAY
jgi:cell division topological specificity factor